MLSRRSHARQLRALVALAITVCGCGTIDPGPPTGPPMGCAGSPTFFVSDIWPNYLDKFSCGKSDCHNQQSGHGYFLLQVDGNGHVASPAPAPAVPRTMWPDDWQFNYANAARLLNCGDPTGSLLLAVPEGKAQPHPGGVVVMGTDADDSEKLFTMWASMQ